MFSGSLRFQYRILRDDAAVVFNLDLELIVRQHAFAEAENFREAVSSQPMIGVLAHVSLEERGLSLSDHATAIDEVFGNVANLRDVGMERDEIAAREEKTGKRAGMLFEERS